MLNDYPVPITEEIIEDCLYTFDSDYEQLRHFKKYLRFLKRNYTMQQLYEDGIDFLKIWKNIKYDDVDI
jgi:hypothetical protein